MSFNYNNNEHLTAWTFSLDGLSYDTASTLYEDARKQQKRLERLDVILDLMGKRREDVLINPLPVPSDNPPKFLQMCKYMYRSHSLFHDEQYGTLNGNNAGDPVKKYVEAQLTSAFNANIENYLITTWYLVKSLEPLLESYFPKLMKSRDIIFYLKGSVAYRLFLIQKAHELGRLDLIDKIKNAYKLGGDNDCSIIINPKLRNYDEVHSQVCTIVGAWMDYIRPILQETPYLKKAADNVREVKIDDDHAGFFVMPTETRSYVITPQPDGSSTVVYGESGSTISTVNTLRFKSATGALAAFVLFRIKWAFEVNGNVYCSEGIDVSIPCKDDEKTSFAFDKYKNGGLMEKLTVGTLTVGFDVGARIVELVSKALDQ